MLDWTATGRKGWMKSPGLDGQLKNMHFEVEQ
jgi:hypothetical protein